MIAWREKTKAFAVHFLVTLALSASAAALVFLVWYPRSVRCDARRDAKLFLILRHVRSRSRAVELVRHLQQQEIAARAAVRLLGHRHHPARRVPLRHAHGGDHPAGIHRVRQGPDRGRVGARHRRCRPARGRGGLSPSTAVGTAAGRNPGAAEMPRSATRCWIPRSMGKDYPMFPAYYVPYEQACRRSKSERCQ